jgi:hypothetical protein
MRVPTVLLLLLAAAVALPSGSASAASTYPVEITCVNADDASNVVRLLTPVRVGDTLEVRYHDCAWVADDDRVHAHPTGPNLVADYINQSGYDLPATEGVVFMSVTTDPRGGDLLASFRQSTTFGNAGALIMQPYLPSPAFRLEAVRDPRRCSTVHITLRGVPAAADLTVSLSLKIGRRSIGTRFDGTGGTGGSWSHAYTVKTWTLHLPKSAFRLTAFPSGWHFDETEPTDVPAHRSVRVPACQS